MAIYSNSGLKMYMESALAAPITITAATNAAPGVFTAANTFVNGDLVLLKVNGMTEVNNRAYKVIAVAAGTFQIANIGNTAGLSTVGFGVFSSGTVEKVTLGTSITGVQDFSPSGGDPKYLSTTTVHDTTDKQIVVGANAITYALTMQWDPADAGQAAMQTAFDTAAPKVFQIKWPNGRIASFYGTVGFAGLPGGASQGVTTTSASIAPLGNLTYGI